MSAEPTRGFLALRDRAYGFLVARGRVTEEVLLTHVYGGAPPPAVYAQLAAPLLGDARLERRPNGDWTAARNRPPTAPAEVEALAVTSLALAASGPNPERGRVVQLCALHVQAGTTIARFTATVNPDARVPRYVAERLGLAPEVLDELPPFGAILDDLVRFLGERPVLAQDATLTWAFLSAEARRVGRVLAEPLLVDANEIATRVLDLKGKPTLALVAARLGIGTVRLTRPEEEARVLGVLAGPLLARASEQGLSLDALLVRVSQTGPLRRGRTPRSQPEAPGVYVLRDVERAALYVGKASRLRSRLAAYVHRPLGITRRLEGLVGSVEAVDATVCATEIEALVLEDREIRRLQPRYNTARQQRPPRLWIRLPPVPTAPANGKRRTTPRRLELSLGPGTADGEFVGPFRNETIAEHTRHLARAVFELDALRRGDEDLYAERLRLAWHFLRVGNQCEAAQAYARRRSTRLLRQVLACDPAALVLPADPRVSRYAVVRPGPLGIEGFLLDRGVFQAWSVVHDDDATRFAADLLVPQEPRTEPEDRAVVLRWFGAQRPPAVLVHVPPSPLEAADAIEVAALTLSDLLRQS